MTCVAESRHIRSCQKRQETIDLRCRMLFVVHVLSTDLLIVFAPKHLGWKNGTWNLSKVSIVVNVTYQIWDGIRPETVFRLAISWSIVRQAALKPSGNGWTLTRPLLLSPDLRSTFVFFNWAAFFLFEWPRSCIRRNSLWSLIFINRVSRFLVKIQHKFIYLFTNIGMKQCLLNSRRSEKCYTSGSYSQFDKSICCWCLANDGYADRLPFLAQPWRRMLKWRGTFKAMA